MTVARTKPTLLRLPCAGPDRGPQRDSPSPGTSEIALNRPKTDPKLPNPQTPKPRLYCTTSRTDCLLLFQPERTRVADRGRRVTFVEPITVVSKALTGRRQARARNMAAREDEGRVCLSGVNHAASRLWHAATRSSVWRRWIGPHFYGTCMGAGEHRCVAPA